MCRINPRIIYAICGACGERGPLRDKPAWDGAAFAKSGLIHILQDKNGYPPVCPPGMGDLVAGISMAYGIAMHCERTGKGQKVDVSLFGSMITAMEVLFLQVSLATGKDYPQYDSSKPGNPLNFTYPTKDNRWILINMHHTNEFCSIFCETVGITNTSMISVFVIIFNVVNTNWNLKQSLRKPGTILRLSRMNLFYHTLIPLQKTAKNTRCPHQAQRRKP